MASKDQRLTRKLFLEVLRAKRVYHTNNLTLRVHKKHDCLGEASRFSFVVSGKVAKRATKRNLLKRKGSSALRKHEKRIKPCRYGAFFFKKNAVYANYKELESEITALLKKSGILTRSNKSFPESS